MAWFKQSADEAAQQTPQVTLARIESYYKAQEWKYMVEDGYVIASFGECVSRFSMVGEGDNSIMFATMSDGKSYPAEQLETALQVCNSWNAKTLLGTAHPVEIENEGGNFRLFVDVAFMVGEGASDEQLSSFIVTALQCGSQGVEEFAEQAELKPLDE